MHTDPVAPQDYPPAHKVAVPARHRPRPPAPPSTPRRRACRPRAPACGHNVAFPAQHAQSARLRAPRRHPGEARPRSQPSATAAGRISDVVPTDAVAPRPPAPTTWPDPATPRRRPACSPRGRAAGTTSPSGRSEARERGSPPRSGRDQRRYARQRLARATHDRARRTTAGSARRGRRTTVRDAWHGERMTVRRTAARDARPRAPTTPSMSGTRRKVAA